jgi:hypothetical protein
MGAEWPHDASRGRASSIGSAMRTFKLRPLSAFRGSRPYLAHSTRRVQEAGERRMA